MHFTAALIKQKDELLLECNDANLDREKPLTSIRIWVYFIQSFAFVDLC